MAIVRNYAKGKVSMVKRPKLTERVPDDFDLEFESTRYYVLDAHEWFDPHTSSKYDAKGVSHHAMYGPAVVYVSDHGGCLQTTEHHVNDPHVWSHVRRVIQSMTAESAE